MRLFIRHLVSE